MAKKVYNNRNELVDGNIEVVKETFAKIKPYLNEKTIIINVTNPVDTITYFMAEISGLPKNHIIGSGTHLDSTRLRQFIASVFDVSPAYVSAMVVGEHGPHSVVLWSSANIAGYSIEEYANMAIGADTKINREYLKEVMHNRAYQIFHQKGSTTYAVTKSIEKVVLAIVHDSHDIIPVSTLFVPDYDEACASVPCVIGKDGIVTAIKPNMNDTEAKEFDDAVTQIKSVIEENRHLI